MGSSTAATPRPSRLALGCKGPHDAARRSRLHLARARGRVRAAITRDTGQIPARPSVLYRGRKQATSEATLTAADTASCSPPAGDLQILGACALDPFHTPGVREKREAADLARAPARPAAARRSRWRLGGVLADRLSGRCRDVDVRPRGFADELLEEGGGGIVPALRLEAGRLERSATVPFISALNWGCSGNTRSLAALLPGPRPPRPASSVVVGDDGREGRAEAPRRRSGWRCRPVAPPRARPRRRRRRRGSAGPRRRCC